MSRERAKVWPDEIELRPHGGDQRCRVTWGGHGAERLPVPQASWFEVLRVAPGAGHMGGRCSTPEPQPVPREL